MADKAVTPAQRNFNFQKIIAGVGAVLMLAKFFAYFLTDSVSILTDALESIVNVVAGFVGLYALYLSMKPADSDHPYGHGKVELISSSVEGSLIAVAGALIIIESIQRMLEGDYTLRDLDGGLVIVALAAVANFAMGFTAIKMGKASKSMALEASGRHLCSDTYSSVGIILGLIVVLVLEAVGVDAYWIDPVMAMLFGVFIIYTGVHVLYRSFNGIMDRVDTEVIKQVTKCLNHVRTDEMIDVHHLRVTRYGAAVHVDGHMTVPGDLTVNETEDIVDMFRYETESMLDNEVDITLMAESCGRLYCRYCKRDCPNRRCDFVDVKRISADSAVRGDIRKGGKQRMD